MAPSAYVSRIARISLVATSLLAGVACAGRVPAPTTTPQTATVAPATAVTPASSVFDLRDYWFSQHVPAARLSSLNGGLLVIGFVDASCPASCVSTLNALRKVEGETDASVHLVVVATASATNSSATLAAFAKERHLPANRYTIISGSESSVAALTAALDSRNLGATASQYAFSGTLSVLDYNGVVVQQTGHGNVAPILEALTLLSNIR